MFGLKKALAAATACSLLIFSAGCTGLPGGETTTGVDGTTADPVTINGDSAYFSDGDLRDVSDETPNATITLSGDTGTISDAARGSSGQTVTVRAKGVYRVTGSSQNVTILVSDDNKSGNVYLVLDSVSMSNDQAPCILVESADKVVICPVGSSELVCTAASAEIKSAISSDDDLSFNGPGSLEISSTFNGVECDNDLRIVSGSLSVRADGVGVKAGDSVRLGGGELAVTSGKDGVKTDSSDGSGYIYVGSGCLTVDAGGDALTVSTAASSSDGGIIIEGGTLDLTSGGGSDDPKDSAVSQKGLKSAGYIKIGGGSVTVSSADDSVHADGDVGVSGGSVRLSTSDDGIHADGRIIISDGVVEVLRSYEGLEGADVNVSGGDVKIKASDDGISAAGGSDSASGEAWDGAVSAGASSINVTGGSLYVDASGDGLDSNGSIFISGGLVIVEGPTTGGNGALDKGEGADCVAEITGGTVLALGTSDMAINFDGGSQRSVLVTISGEAGDVISVDDGSGFTFTATKSFECAVYSSPYLTADGGFTLKAGARSVLLDG